MANYIRENWSADLDFGTGEWSASAWVNIPTSLPESNFPVVGSNLFNDANAVFYGEASKISEGVYRIYSSAGIQCGVYFSNTLTVGNVYKVSVSVISVTIKGAGVVIGPSSAVSYSTIPSTVGDYSVSFVATSSNLYFWRQAGITDVEISNIVIMQVAPALIADRAYSSGAKLHLGVDITGRLTATAFDGTTTRFVSTSTVYNTATWAKAEACYTTDGTLSIRVNGNEVAVTRGNPLLTLNSRYNGLTYTEDLSNAAWIKRSVTATSNQITASAGTGDRCAVNSVAGLTGPLTGTVDIKAGTAAFAWVTLSPVFGLSNYATAVVDLTAGTVSKTQAGGTVSITASSLSEPDADGYRKLTLSVSSSSSGMSLVVGICTSSTPTINSYGAVDFTAAGTETVLFRKAQLETGSTAKTYQRVGAATDFDFAAPLTIGNSYALDAPFPGSLALLKLSATVPTAEQSQWMYEQEKQMFRENAQVCLPDSGNIVDLAYDDATDTWIAASASNISEWSGLVRTNVTPVPAGSYSKVSAASGVKLAARTTTSPGVDITIPASTLKEELVKRNEAAAKMSQQLAIFDYTCGFTASTTTGNTAITSVSGLSYPQSYIGAKVTGTGIPADTVVQGVSGTTIYLSKAATATATGVQISFNDYVLPVGYEAKTVMQDGAVKQEGSTKTYTRLFDGFKETIRFAVAPSYQAWVQIQATRSVQ